MRSSTQHVKKLHEREAFVHQAVFTASELFSCWFFNCLIVKQLFVSIFHASANLFLLTGQSLCRRIDINKKWPCYGKLAGKNIFKEILIDSRKICFAKSCGASWTAGFEECLSKSQFFYKQTNPSIIPIIQPREFKILPTMLQMDLRGTSGNSI